MEENSVAYIYSLLDPTNDLVRYIGWTSSIDKRYKEHLKEAKSGSKNHRCNWIRLLLSQNKFPIIKIIEEVPYSKRHEREIYWIAYYGRENLVNGSNGGEGNKGLVVSESVKKYLSDMFSGEGNPFYGKKHTEEAIEKMRNKIVSNDTKEKIRNAHLGKKLTEDHKKKISDTIRKNPPFLGKKHTEDSKKKNRDSHIGKPAWNKNKRTNLPSHNRGIKSRGKSPYIGVSIKGNGFCARVHVNGERIYLYGTQNEENTAIAYDIGAIFYYGKNSNLNFSNFRNDYIFHLEKYKVENIYDLRNVIKYFLEEME